MARSHAVLLLLFGFALGMAPAAGAAQFSDDFNRSTLGPDWVVDTPAFSLIGNQLVENSAVKFSNARLRWTAGATDGIDQYGKLQVTNQNTHSWGFMFRVNGTPGLHYEIHLPAANSTWRWERYDPGFIARQAECLGDGLLSNGNWIGVTIEGTGASTLVSVWRWNTDPDSGGPVDISANWGPPDCTMTGAAGPYVDTGTGVGIRSYTGSSTAAAAADNWFAGDVPSAPPACTTGAECADGNPCTDDVCNAGFCENPPNTAPCDDGSACTTGDVCSGGICGGTLIDCDDGNVCTDDSCDALTGCVNTPNTASCDDGDACTTGDTCSGGVCGGGPPLDCGDGNVCTDDSCDALTGCVNTPNTASCEDGLFCNGAEVCQDGACVAGPDPCPASCDEGTDTCFACVDAGDCDDGDLCTVDTCEAGGVCQSTPVTCPGGQECNPSTGVCEASGQLFSDDFNRASLGSNWVIDTPNFAISANQLIQNSGVKFQNPKLRWVGGATDTIDQFGKLQVTNAQPHPFGLMLRINGTPGLHYQIHPAHNSSQWRWERYNPGFDGRLGDCIGDGPLASGDWIGATVEGTGVATLVSVWRWNADPDSGGPPDIVANWGPPDCTMSATSGAFIDSGTGVGIRAYTGNSTASGLADNWSSGDTIAASVDPPVCGNGVPETGEECDDGGESATCDADCTAAVCGDGTVNATAGEQCEDDLDCTGGDVCTACTCGPPPVCGNGIPEPGEECDDGGESATCDADCTAAACGDGTLNATAGEECESDLDCSGGLVCGSACSCVTPGQAFSDAFDRATLGPNWSVDSLSFVLSGNQLLENSGAKFANAQLRWLGGGTDTPGQYGKLQPTSVQTHSWGFMFRVNGTPGLHYEVHLPAGSSSWRWERYDPGFLESKGTCLGDGQLLNGDWIGAAIIGSGAATQVHVWRWNSDPDGGGPVDILANWGPPDCTFAAAAGPYVDTGTGLGIRSYTGGSTANASADNWFAGDFDGSVAPPGSNPISVILDSSGAGLPGLTMIDPDGVTLDPAGNVYVAACGLGNGSEGVFKVAPDGTKTQLLGSTSDDGVSCPVGIAYEAATGNVYVAAYLSDNVVEIAPGGAITEIIDATGDGSSPLTAPVGVAVDSAGNVYVTGTQSDNVFRITPGGVITEIIDATGDGAGNPLLGPFGVDVDGADNVLVAGFDSDNVFEVTPGGTITEIIDASGDGAGNPLNAPHSVIVDVADNVYVTGNVSDNVFEVTPGGTITEILDSSGDGRGNLLNNPTCIAHNSAGDLYVAAFDSDNVFEIAATGGVTEILDSSGDGSTCFLNPSDFCLAADDFGNVFAAGTACDAVFKIER